MVTHVDIDLSPFCTAQNKNTSVPLTPVPCPLFPPTDPYRCVSQMSLIMCRIWGEKEGWFGVQCEWYFVLQMRHLPAGQVRRKFVTSCCWTRLRQLHGVQWDSWPLVGSVKHSCISILRFNDNCNVLTPFSKFSAQVVKPSLQKKVCYHMQWNDFAVLILDPLPQQSHNISQRVSEYHLLHCGHDIPKCPQLCPWSK